MNRLSISFLVLVTAVPAAAQEPPRSSADHALCAAPAGAVDPAILERPVPLREGIGKISQKVTTESPRAQTFYDQGLAYLVSYVWIEAARSFREALRSDPDCAMAWVGLARAEQALSRDKEAGAAIEKARALAGRVSEREKRHIALRAQQIEAEASTGEKERERHQAYKDALDKAIAADPSDAELWVLRGNAEEPGAWGRGQAGGVGAIAYYESTLLRSPGHLAAHHFLIHAFENVGRHAEAAEHGKVYAAAAPKVAHAQHMYGHVLPRVGRWKEALEQFEKADAIEREYAREEKIRPGDDWHHIHNLQLLAYTYLRQGRLWEAERTFRRAYATPARSLRSGWQQASLAEFLLLRGRAEEALATARELSKRSPTIRAAGAAVEGEVLLALGRPGEAREAAARGREALKEAKKLAGHDARWIERFVQPHLDQLQAEIDMAGAGSAAAEGEIRSLAAELAANPRFDAWGEGLFRLERIAEQAKRSGRAALAAEIHAQMRHIDPEYTAGSTALPIESPEVASAGR